jgi:hypothetical protein
LHYATRLAIVGFIKLPTKEAGVKTPETRKKRRTANPFGRLDLRIEVSQEEILADLQYPANRRRNRRRP